MARFESTGMSEVTVRKQDLLDTLKKNREAHRSVFAQALIAFRQKALAELDQLIAQVNEGKPVHIYSRLPVPEEHTADYDRAIDMLRMHVGDTVTLNEEAYAKFVADDWGWKSSFIANTGSYISA